LRGAALPFNLNNRRILSHIVQRCEGCDKPNLALMSHPYRAS
jgi:hypothetical protein